MTVRTRSLIALIIIAYLGLTHFSYLAAYQQGNVTEYSNRVSNTPFTYINLVLALVVILLAVLPTKEASQ
jgi:hypothetical protein